MKRFFLFLCLIILSCKDESKVITIFDEVKIQIPLDFNLTKKQPFLMDNQNENECLILNSNSTCNLAISLLNDNNFNFSFEKESIEFSLKNRHSDIRLDQINTSIPNCVIIYFYYANSSIKGFKTSILHGNKILKINFECEAKSKDQMLKVISELLTSLSIFN